MKQQITQLSYKTKTEANRTTVIIYFPSKQFEQIPSFRSALHDEINKVTEFQYRIDTGLYEDIDVNIRFFNPKDSDIVNAFYSRSWPGCFSWLFRTRHYRDYKAEETRVRQFISIEISTSHDPPWFTVSTSTFTEDTITQLIEKVGRDLNLDITKA